MHVWIIQYKTRNMYLDSKYQFNSIKSLKTITTYVNKLMWVLVVK